MIYDFKNQNDIIENIFKSHWLTFLKILINLKTLNTVFQMN
jgi:hypothetical protein